MSKSILLARPHPFLVETMKPWMESMGYQVRRIDSLSELNTLNDQAFDGIVISLALSSSVSESADSVLHAVRRRFTNTPIMFASLLEFDRIQRVVEQMLADAGISGTLLHSQSNASHPALGNGNTFLYLSNRDLVENSSRQRSSQLIQKHFA